MKLVIFFTLLMSTPKLVMLVSPAFSLNTLDRSVSCAPVYSTSNVPAGKVSVTSPSLAVNSALAVPLMWLACVTGVSEGFFHITTPFTVTLMTSPSGMTHFFIADKSKLIRYRPF